MSKDSAPTAIAQALLAWYDTHARVLPWRIPPGSNATPDPYRVWLSEVMLQQTTVAAVGRYYARFLALWPRVQDLAAAPDAQVMGEWAGLGYYARARNLLKCARAVAALGGFPDTRDGLLTLPGIGPYTASAIAAIAFGQPEAVVDGNVERVVARLFAIRTPLPKLKAEVTEVTADLTPKLRPGDYAQGMMDLGATICTPKRPSCEVCPLAHVCVARAEGAPESYPFRAPKVVRPRRVGIAYVAVAPDGRMLVERRPDRGLLGGMLGFPTGPWGSDAVAASPLAAEWQAVGQITHVFTHFHLTLTVMLAKVPGDAPFVAVQRSELPSLMKKVFDLVVG